MTTFKALKIQFNFFTISYLILINIIIIYIEKKKTLNYNDIIIYHIGYNN
jgi:hypothetical protein